MRPLPPDFVIAGAPKCGTTAIYETLIRQRDIFLCRIKEPHYFAYDFPKRREVETEEDYDSLFQGAQTHQLRGEASALYLASKRAVDEVLRRRPDARFIAVVRNPVDMFISWHNECLKSLDEEEADPQRAWALQQTRADGLHMPKLCKEPAFLQYKTICSLGAQIQSLFRLVPERQRLVLVYDDLVMYPRRFYEQIINVIGAKDNGTKEFVRENVFARPKSEFIARLIRSAYLSASVKKVRIKLKPILNEHGIRPIGWLLRHNLKGASKPPLSNEFRRHLQEVFALDVGLLESLLFRKLADSWFAVDSQSATVSAKEPTRSATIGT